MIDVFDFFVVLDSCVCVREGVPLNKFDDDDLFDLDFFGSQASYFDTPNILVVGRKNFAFHDMEDKFDISPFLEVMRLVLHMPEMSRVTFIRSIPRASV